MPIVKTSREELIKNSFKVFLEKGYYHTTVADLAKACNIEKPHFYYYFKSKRDLMISVLAFIRSWARKNMFAHAYNTDLSARERMEKLLGVLKEVHKHGFGGCIFSNTALETANTDDEFLPILQRYFDTWHQTLQTIYECKYNREESAQRATRFFSELNGAILLQKVYKDHKYLDAFIENQLKEL